MLAITGKLDRFRGDSRFTTWAYKFVIFEVSAKLGRHYWRNPPVQVDSDAWERMTGWRALDQFLQTDPQDVGCDQAMEILDLYVDAVIRQGADATERRYPGVAAHLRACGPCGEDFAGLLAAVS